MKQQIFFIFLLLICSILNAADPGIILLHSNDKNDSLSIHPRWFEKYRTPSIRCDSKQKITLKQAKNNVVVVHSLQRKFRYEQALNKDTVFCSVSMFESTEIPANWVKKLNRYFDFVAVPDPFLIEVYQNSGVRIPIFTLPIGCFLEDWLALPKKTEKGTPFVFFSSGNLYSERKNMHLLVKAFQQVFGDNPNVVLRLRVYAWINRSLEELLDELQLTDQTNIELYYENMSDDQYRSLFLTSDCYVNISAGEGFSITPREALAIGLPTILTDNTAQSVICRTGYVKSVKCKEEVPYYWNGENFSGYYMNPTIEDVSEALRDVYSNYDKFFKMASQATPWLQQYTAPELIPKWESLLHPKLILLGNENKVTDEYFMTDSPELYEKYRKLMD